MKCDEIKLWIVKLPVACVSRDGSESRMEKILEVIAGEKGGTTGTGVKDGADGFEAAKGVDAKNVKTINGADEFIETAGAGLLKGTRLIFAAEIPKSGVNIDVYRVIEYMQRISAEKEFSSKLVASDEKEFSSQAADDETGDCGDLLHGSVGGVIVDGDSKLYTKDAGRRLIFAANAAGCCFPGKPLVEATEDLCNFKVLAGLWNTDLYGAYLKSCVLLAEKLLSFSDQKTEKPNILVIHASNRRTSNSLSLWKMISSEIGDSAEIEEISMRNGQVWDCRGCKYEECLHFGEKGACFYGGVMVEKVYPAIVKCDVLVLICPNYNDSVSANIMASVNRLTSVFRANDFSGKRIFAVIVSGYSGGDIVAQQVIGAINVNKNFMLPANFAIIETANDPGEIKKLDGIRERARRFAERLLKS